MNQSARKEALRTEDGFESLLRDAGMRVTRPRLTVLEVVTRASREHEHLSTSEVADRARTKLHALSTQAVYNCLDALTGAGLLRRIQPAGSPVRYESRVADNHHHVVCRHCGSMADVDCVVGPTPCLTYVQPSEQLSGQLSGQLPGQLSGYVVDEAEIVFWGSCPACSRTHHQHTHHITSKEK